MVDTQFGTMSFGTQTNSEQVTYFSLHVTIYIYIYIYCIFVYTVYIYL